MKKLKCMAVVGLSIIICISSYAQDQQIQTVFKGGHASGAYGALTNKFTSINGQYANMAGVYGGWYINHWFMIGLGGSAVTSNVPVQLQYSANPSLNLSYEYGQFGLMTEYVIASRKAVHVTFSLFSGTGFTMQYQRYDWNNDFNQKGNHVRDENWFFVMEPGTEIEINVFKWMRFSPGVSYRATMGSKGMGLGDAALSNVSYNATLKIGKF